MAKNSYVLGKRIARGGMAEIYLGKAVGEAAFQKIVAIKRILPHYAQDKEFIEMFRDEAHICKRLQHNNIVQVYDFTEVDGSYALIMEHVDGADLRSLLSACETAKTRLSVPMALFIAGCAARALHYAHTKTDEITNEALGIVHRDVSPQNILISYEGDVKITDFGIASAENKLTETRPGVVKGKYSYMSPEQVAAKPLDGRSDVFSLAIVLWETLAMKRLFAGMTEVESIRKVQNCEIPYDICELNPEIDQELKVIVMKGLSKDRKLRYQTAAAFEKDLLRYLHSRYAEFTSRELGNFLKRILAKKRDRTQDDIKETLAQNPEPAVNTSQTMTVQQAHMQMHQAQIQMQMQMQQVANSGLGPPENSKNMPLEDVMSPNFRPMSQHKSSAIDDRSISVSSSFRRNIPSRLMDGGSLEGSQSTRARPRQAIAQPARRPKRNTFPLFMLIIGALAAAAYYFRDEFAPDKKLHLELRTAPEVISLRINGLKLEDGNYRRTPIKLNLAPGSYEMEMTRPGYQKEIIRFQGNAGEILRPEKVFLKRLPHVTLTPLRIVSTGDRVTVNVDGGLFEGETPLTVDLLPNSPHFMTFSMPGDTNPYRCEIKLDRQSVATSANTTLIVTPPVNGQKARCQIKY